MWGSIHHRSRHTLFDRETERYILREIGEKLGLTSASQSSAPYYYWASKGGNILIMITENPGQDAGYAIYSHCTPTPTCVDHITYYTGVDLNDPHFLDKLSQFFIESHEESERIVTNRKRFVYTTISIIILAALIIGFLIKF